MLKLGKVFKSVVLGVSLLGLAACSTVGSENVPTRITAPASDPFKDLNEFSFAANKVMDRYMMRPISSGYRKVVPQQARYGIRNLLRNLMEPRTAINEILQLDFAEAGHTTARFIVNSTVGIAGLFDPAKKIGLDRHEEDLGQTLAVWGVPPGPYIMLPFFGPSNARDTFGLGVDFLVEPVSTIAHNNGYHIEAYSRTFMEGLDFRARNHDIITEFIEKDHGYIRFKSFYEQTRAYEIRNGQPAPDEEDLFDFEDDCFDEGTSEESPEAPKADSDAPKTESLSNE